MEQIRLRDEAAFAYQDMSDMIGRKVTVRGMVQNYRRLAWGGFLLLRTPADLIQVVVNADKPELPLDRVRPEVSVLVTGTVKKAKIKDRAVRPNTVEIEASSIEVVSEPAVTEFPVDITKKEISAGQSTVFDYRPLTLRHPKHRALFRIQASVQNAFGAYLTSIGFTRIASPKLAYSGAEGGANIFALDYFGRQAFLAQSPQFYKQIMVAVFGRVFEQAPVFRAEKHNTSRHLNEYISLDFEMQLEESYREIMEVEALTINAILRELERTCAHELALLEISLPKPIEELALIEFDEAHEIVFRETGADHRGEPDLAPEEEVCVSGYAARELGAEFVFVTRFPASKRPFYTMDDPERPDRTLSFDLLFRGVEITTGGQRLHRYEDYRAKMDKLGMNPADFDPYLQAFRFGMPPHGGLGFGLERFTARICGIENVKALSLFPRDVNRLEP